MGLLMTVEHQAMKGLTTLAVVIDLITMRRDHCFCTMRDREEYMWNLEDSLGHHCVLLC